MSVSRQKAAGRPFHGMTLVELLIVLAIVSLLGGIAVPRFSNAATHRRVEAAARRIAADLALAREQAVLKSRNQTVRFNTAGRSYELVGVRNLDHSTKPYTVLLSEAPYLATSMTANLGGDQEVIFDMFGRPDSGGTVVVKAGTWQQTVSLNAETGIAATD